MRTLNYRSILVASDLTVGCDTVIRAAARLAEHADAELHVVHAYELPALPHHDERRYGTAYQNRIGPSAGVLPRALAERRRSGPRPGSREVAPPSDRGRAARVSA